MNRLFVTAGTTFTAILSVLLFFGNKWADDHTFKMSGGLKLPTNCLSCHAYMGKNTFVKGLLAEDYLSPNDLTLSADGKRLFVVAEDANVILEVSTETGKVEQRIPVGDHPHSIVLSPDGRQAFVTNNWDDDVTVLDLDSDQVTDTIQVGMGPTGLAFDRDGHRLFVANGMSDDISVVDASTGAESYRLAAGNNPYAVSPSPDGRIIIVTNRLTNPIEPRDKPVAELTMIDASTGRILVRNEVTGAHLFEGIDYTPQSDLALFTLIRPKNLVPSTQLTHGWMLTYGIGVVDLKHENRVAQLLLDDVNEYYSDPYDLVVTPDGKKAFVSNAGADCISVIDLDAVRTILAAATPDSLAGYANDLGLSSRFVVKRIKTGSNPKSMAISNDGKTLYVSERLEDRIGVIDTDRLEVTRQIDLGGPKDVNVVRLGEKMFHGARALQGQFSCRSCHPDGAEDALAWDFGGDGLGRNIVNTMTLREVGQTSPFKWAGTNVSLYMQDGIRFARHLTRVDPWPSDQLKAIVAYMYSIPAPPNRYHQPGTALTEAQARGKMIFERSKTFTGKTIPDSLRCTTCHNGPFFTNRQKFNVGTSRSTDNMKVFDTPQLVNIIDSAPYLHDGAAQSLEEIWTLNSLNDEHGIVSDFNKNQLNDLIEYLRTLGPPVKANRETYEHEN